MNTATYYLTCITIYYFIANEMEWCKVHTPYNPQYVKDICKVPTSHYDTEEKSWCCKAVHGTQMEHLVKKHFPDIPVAVENNRAFDDIYKQKQKSLA